MKKKQNEKPNTKQNKTTGIFLCSLVISSLTLLLGFICKMAYDDISEPDYNTCYVYTSDGSGIAKIDSIYNDDEVSYILVDLEYIPTIYTNRSATEKFLQNYKKLPDCSTFYTAKYVAEQYKKLNIYENDIRQLIESIGSKK